jgi:triosephosphate isomerase
MPQASGPQRRPFIVANWKMFKNGSETEAFIREFAPKISPELKADVALCPPFPWLAMAAASLKGTPIAVGAQNVNDNPSGAFTGEIAASMLVAAGCRYVIIGHSERRQYYGETDALVNKKIRISFENGLTPIVCVGESLAEREGNKTLEVVTRQVKGALEGLPSQNTQKVVLAYEPIWAIGTGRTATPAQAQEVHLAIRDILKDQYGSLTSHSVRILYGGSVKPDNMATLMACEDIDGGLVGGASLDPASFLAIVNYQDRQPAGR